MTQNTIKSIYQKYYGQETRVDLMTGRKYFISEDNKIIYLDEE